MNLMVVLKIIGIVIGYMLSIKASVVIDRYSQKKLYNFNKKYGFNYTDVSDEKVKYIIQHTPVFNLIMAIHVKLSNDAIIDCKLIELKKRDTDDKKAERKPEGIKVTNTCNTEKMCHITNFEPLKINILTDEFSMDTTYNGQCFYINKTSGIIVSLPIEEQHKHLKNIISSFLDEINNKFGSVETFNELLISRGTINLNGMNVRLCDTTIIIELKYLINEKDYDKKKDFKKMV